MKNGIVPSVLCTGFLVSFSNGCGAIEAEDGQQLACCSDTYHKFEIRSGAIVFGGRSQECPGVTTKVKFMVSGDGRVACWGSGAEYASLETRLASAYERRAVPAYAT